MIVDDSRSGRVFPDDGGSDWVGVPAPRTGLTLPQADTSDPVDDVERVRFSDALNGFAFGPGLWATHDGARTWHRLDVGGHCLGRLP